MTGAGLCITDLAPRGPSAVMPDAFYGVYQIGEV